MQITDVKVHCYSYPSPALISSSFGPQQEATLVSVETDTGITGYGSCRAQGGTSGRVLAEAVLATAKPRLLGRDPVQREAIWQSLWALDRGQYMPIFVTGALDVALWDLAGKALGAPVWHLLGGYRDRLPAYASSATLPGLRQYVDEARACQARGYRAYKIHPPGPASLDVAICRAVRQAVGPELRLMLDPISRYNRQEALRVGRELEKLNFYWYEEPIDGYDLAGYAELSRALDIPVVACETVPGSLHATAQFIHAGAGDILRADVYWRGGITGVMKTAHLCEGFGIPCEMHHAATPLMDVANLHCACAIANCEYFEVLVPEETYRYGLKTYAEIDSEGYMQAPQGPGLGVEVDWDYIEGHTTFRG